MSELSFESRASDRPWWQRPFWISALVAVVLLAAALAWPLLKARVDGPAAAPQEGLPWQVKTQTDSSEVFGLLVGQSGVAEARKRFADDLKLGLMWIKGEESSANDTPALEGFVDSFQAGFVSGRLVLAFEADDSLRRKAMARAARSDVGEGGRSRILTLSAPDLDLSDERSLASQARLVGLSFIPAARLDEATITARFGQPAERLSQADGSVQLLYPALGVAVAVPGQSDAKAKVVIQYVAPGDFEARLRWPLAAASGVTPAASAPQQ